MPGRLCWGQALGVYLAEGRLTLTAIASSLAGTKVLASFSQSVQEASPGSILGHWLEENFTPHQRRRLSVCIGLGAEQTFYSTSTMVAQNDSQEVTVERLLSNSRGWVDDDTAAADFVPFKLAGTAHYSVSACQRKLAEELLSTLREAGVSQCRLGPAPWYFVESAKRGARVPRSWKTFINVLLNDAGGLAMLVTEGRPVLWRRFAMVGQESLAVASAIRHIELHARGSLGIDAIAGVVVQGKVSPQLTAKLPEDIKQEILFKTHADLDAAAFSLAMARQARSHELTLDLFKRLRPPMGVAQMFPRKLAAVLLMAVGGMGLCMYNQLSEVQADTQRVQSQCASYGSTSSPKDELKQLETEVSAVQEFLATRVIWSDYLRDLPTRLPPNAALQSFQGAYEMDDLSSKSIRKRVNRSLLLRCMARFTDRNSAPHEIDSFLDSLRNVELLKRDFPLVGLAEIKWRREGLSDVAQFTVIAMPPPKAAPSAEENGKGGKEGAKSAKQEH